MADADKKHVWQVGDLCMLKDEDEVSVVWRLIDVESAVPGLRVEKLWIKPIFSLFVDVNRLSVRERAPGKCVPVTLLDLGDLRSRLDIFMQEEARKRGEGG